MKIQEIQAYSYKIPLAFKQQREGIFIELVDQNGQSVWGEIAPLPLWSKETLADSIDQLNQKKIDIIKIDWTSKNWDSELAKLALLPALSFGLESALLSLLMPLGGFSVPATALLMGTCEEILKQAEVRHTEGYTSAKLKVSNLGFDEATSLIHKLKNRFRLRIDVNRAWTTNDSMKFFSQFPLNAFDYVEEPFQNPKDLKLFPHPLAIDESFPDDLSLKELESLPTLKALIFKPTIQGGMLNCLPLHEWANKRRISLVLSSSFETDLGLSHVASMAQRLSLKSSVGIGTYHYLSNHICSNSLQFSHSLASIPAQLVPKMNCIRKIKNTI